MSLQTGDIAWVVVLSRESAQASVQSISRKHDETEAVVTNVSPGVNLISCRLVKDGQIYIRFRRDNRERLTHFHPDFVFTSSPRTYNFNAFVAMDPSEPIW